MAALQLRGANGSGDIWLVHLDSLDKPRPFLTEAYTESSPAVSPDGELLAYVTNRTGRSEVYVRPMRAGAREVLVSTDGGNEPVWSPIGRELFYRTSDFMMAATLSGGAQPAVTKRESLFRDTYQRSGFAPFYDVFPNGREFVMVRSARSLDSVPLIVLMNWQNLGGRSR